MKPQQIGWLILAALWACIAAAIAIQSDKFMAIIWGFAIGHLVGIAVERHGWNRL